MKKDVIIVEAAFRSGDGRERVKFSSSDEALNKTIREGSDQECREAILKASHTLRPDLDDLEFVEYAAPHENVLQVRELLEANKAEPPEPEKDRVTCDRTTYGSNVAAWIHHHPGAKYVAYGKTYTAPAAERGAV